MLRAHRMHQLLAVSMVFLGAAGMTEAAAPATPTPAGAVKKVTVVVPDKVGAPAHYGIQKLEDALRARGIAVAEGDAQVAASDVVVVADVWRVANAETPALSIKTGVTYHDKPAIALTGGDEELMYAALD